MRLPVRGFCGLKKVRVHDEVVGLRKAPGRSPHGHLEKDGLTLEGSEKRKGKEKGKKGRLL